jgi:type II secretory pathway component PulK
LISENSPREPSQGSQSDPNATEQLDLQTFYQIADKITVSGGQTQSKVNINTAPEEVLTALLGGGDEAGRIAEEIITYRNRSIYGMESIAELLSSGTVNLDTFKRIANSIMTRSDVFTISCFATADRNGNQGATLRTDAVVDRTTMPCQILYWYEGTSN